MYIQHPQLNNLLRSTCNQFGINGYSVYVSDPSLFQGRNNQMLGEYSNGTIR